MKSLFLLFFLFSLCFVSPTKVEREIVPPPDFVGIVAPFQNLIPFSEEELSLFKTYGVDRVVKETKGKPTIKYYFNRAGDLTLEEHLEITKNQDIVQNRIKYKYDNHHQLIERREGLNEFWGADSIAYDNQGRVVYSRHYEHWLGYEGPLNQVILTLKSTHPNFYILDAQDSAWGYTEYYISNQNKLLKAYRHGELKDSLTFETEAGKAQTQRYYRKEGDKVFLLREGHYENERIQRLDVFKRYEPNSLLKTVYYTYNQNNQLIQEEEIRDQKTAKLVWYVRDEKGLTAKKVTTSKYGEVFVEKYYYDFW